MKDLFDLQLDKDFEMKLPDGSLIHGPISSLQYHMPQDGAAYADIEIRVDGWTYRARWTGAGVPTAHTGLHELPMSIGFDGVILDEALKPWGELKEEIEAGFDKGPAPTADLSQIKADLAELKKKQPPEVAHLAPEATHPAVASTPWTHGDLYEKMMTDPAAFAEDYMGSFYTKKPKKPLADTLMDLVKEIGHQLQQAPQSELDEVLKHGLIGMNIPLMPDIPAQVLSADDKPMAMAMTTIKVLHIRLEVSE